MWVMGEWAVGHWIVGIMSFQKIYGLYGLKHHIVEISGDVTKAGRGGKRKVSEQGNAEFRTVVQGLVVSKHYY